MSENTGNPVKERIWEIIFKADTPEGKIFDVALLIAIVASVIVVMLETVQSLEATYQKLFYTLEWVFTIFFTIEYVLRLYCAADPKKYAKSFFGVIDLLSILPAFLAFLPHGQSLMIIRGLRLLRVFRIFKMASFLREGHLLVTALKASVQKILVFLFVIIVLVCIFGSIMYLIETGPNSQFTSIPKSVYWAIVTLTTVGYGDIAPQTNLGQFIASVIMVIGYAVIAIPTGIVSSEVIKADNKASKKQFTCDKCGVKGHYKKAEFCFSCGHELHRVPVELHKGF